MKNTNNLNPEVLQQNNLQDSCFFEKGLHQKFVILGNNRRKLTNELLALLPEIYERGIYKKYVATIVEYAGKFGGLSKGVVMKRLSLEKYLKDKPKLKEAIKTEGVHKVALIAKLATKETENVWVDKLKNMSKASLFELAKEVREKTKNGKCENPDFGFCKAALQKVKIELEGELLFMFLKMKKKYGKNLNNNEVMKKILEDAVNLSKAGHREVSGSQSERASYVEPVATYGANVATQSSSRKVQFFPGKKVTRYVKAEIKKQTLSSTNGKCLYPGCENPAETLHHPERFANNQTHNNLKPLCKIHHEFMHNGLIENEQNPANDWHLNLDKELDSIDLMYRNYRRLAI